MVTLTGEHAKAFHNALCTAFPDASALAQMLRFNLDVSLDRLTSEAQGLDARVFALLDWAESRGRVEELLRGALEARPQNSELLAFAATCAFATEGPRVVLSVAQLFFHGTLNDPGAFDALDAFLLPPEASLDGFVPSDNTNRGLNLRVRGLVLGAFLHAFRDFYHDPERTPTTRARRVNRVDPQFYAAIDEHVLRAVRTLAPLEVRSARAEQLSALTLLEGLPLASPFYFALWENFTQPSAGSKALVLLDPVDRSTFEHYVLLAWWQLLESRAGALLRADLEAVKQFRPRMLRQFLLADMASWGERHVFGNRTRAEYGDDLTVPFLPLGVVYVEPEVVATPQGAAEVRGGARAVIEELLHKGHKILVITADFGNGKSLTARSLAAWFAEVFLHAKTPSASNWLPIFARCADCMDSPPDVEASVRTALKKHAAHIDSWIDFDEKDPAYGWPDANQKALVFLDGLDEVVWSTEGLRKLFAMLAGKSTSNHRFLLFSRPGVLPEREERQGAVEVKIQPLDPPRVSAWLERWNRLVPDWRRALGLDASSVPALTLNELQTTALDELTRTPILLFLVAHGYALSGNLRGSRAELYEEFFWHIAHGKYKHAGETQPVLRAAAERLGERLKARGLLAIDAKPAMAMLWLMSRVAWESSRREWQRRVKLLREGREESSGETTRVPLTRVDVHNIIREELDADDRELLTSIQVGVLLALQADLRGDDDEILYGHRSFREFLIARFWADRLRATIDARERDQDEELRVLMDGRLLAEEDRSIVFLKEILAADCAGRAGEPFGWRDRRGDLRAFCWRMFLREDPWIPPRKGTGTRVHDDLRPPLREAMLAIANALEPVILNGVAGSSPLRSLLGYFGALAIGVELRLPGANLSDARLVGADLSGARLSNANFSGARLNRANLSGAFLNGTNLSSANLDGARLNRASLVGAVLSGANLDGSALNAANLRNASLTNASLIGANLDGAILDGANLDGAILDDARLDGARLDGALLNGARLNGARLDQALQPFLRFPTRDESSSTSPKAKLPTNNQSDESPTGNTEHSLSKERPIAE